MRSDKHNKIQDSIKKYYADMGWIAIKEHFIKGKKIDVLAQNISTKYTVANEVQLSLKHSLENIVLDLKVGCDEVKIISTNIELSKKIENKIRSQLSKSILEKVNFHIADEFIPYLHNNK